MSLARSIGTTAAVTVAVVNFSLKPTIDTPFSESKSSSGTCVLTAFNACLCETMSQTVRDLPRLRLPEPNSTVESTIGRLLNTIPAGKNYAVAVAAIDRDVTTEVIACEVEGYYRIGRSLYVAHVMRSPKTAAAVVQQATTITTIRANTDGLTQEH